MVALAFAAGIFKTRAVTLWGAAVDYGVGGHTDLMRTAVLGMLIFIVLDGIRTGAHYTVIGYATEGLFFDMRRRLFSALCHADTATLERQAHSGDIALRACEDTERLCDVIAGNFSHFMRLIFQAIFAIVVCLLLSWQLAIAYFLVLPLSLYVLSAVSRPLERLQAEARGGAGRSVDVATDALSAIHAVKMYGVQDEMDKRFAKHVDESFARSIRAMRIGMGMTTIKYTVAVVQTLVLFVIGAWLVGRGLVSIGAVMAFVALAVYVTEAMGMVDRMIFRVKEASALAGRIYEVLELPDEEEVLAKNGNAPAPTEAGEEYVRFTNLHFAYEKGGAPVLAGINLVVHKGQKVAIIGASGAGKSTLVKIICRLYGYSGGSAVILPRQRIALVSQEAGLFEGTIYENVQYGNPAATQADIENALKAADLWGFVSTLPQGVHTPLSEFGASLSGGQRQRLSIARALVKNADLVLLDEATSALDIKTEQEVQHALDNLLHNRAAIIVAHRLTTVQKADYIYCMDGGRITEEGPPAQLRTAGGYYAEMCELQGVT